MQNLNRFRWKLITKNNRRTVYIVRACVWSLNRVRFWRISFFFLLELLLLLDIIYQREFQIILFCINVLFHVRVSRPLILPEDLKLRRCNNIILQPYLASAFIPIRANHLRFVIPAAVLWTHTRTRTIKYLGLLLCCKNLHVRLIKHTNAYVWFSWPRSTQQNALNTFNPKYNILCNIGTYVRYYDCSLCPSSGYFYLYRDNHKTQCLYEKQN